MRLLLLILASLVVMLLMVLSAYLAGDYVVAILNRSFGLEIDKRLVFWGLLLPLVATPIFALSLGLLFVLRGKTRERRG